jgi:hypothetical protein
MVAVPVVELQEYPELIFWLMNNSRMVLIKNIPDEHMKSVVIRKLPLIIYFRRYVRIACRM